MSGLDSMGAFAVQQHERRNLMSGFLLLGGIQPPATEREWLQFNVNQRLRDMGVGKPLPWDEDMLASYTENPPPE